MWVVLGGMTLLVAAGIYQPQLLRAVQSAWTYMQPTSVHNEMTSTDTPQPTSYQPRTMFTTSQQNLKSKSATSDKLDHRVLSQMDQIIASIAGFHHSASDPGTAGFHQSSSIPGTDGFHQSLSIPGTDAFHQSLSDPGTPIPAVLSSAPELQAVSEPELLHEVKDQVKSTTSVDNKTATRQPEVTSLFSGNPGPPPITTFANEFTFNLKTPAAAATNGDLPPQTVDVNELVASLANNPWLADQTPTRYQIPPKREVPSKRPEPPKMISETIQKTVGSTHDARRKSNTAVTLNPPEHIFDKTLGLAYLTDASQKSTTIVLPPTVPAERHVSMAPSKDKVVISPSFTARNESNIRATSAEARRNANADQIDRYNRCLPLQKDLNSDNRLLPSQTNLSSSSGEIESNKPEVHRTTSGLRMQAPVPTIASQTDLQTSKSTTSQRSTKKLDTKHKF